MGVDFRLNKTFLLTLTVIMCESTVFVTQNMKRLNKVYTVDPGYSKLAYKNYPLIVNAYLGPDWQFHSF